MAPVPPLRPRHYPPVPGEVKRTDADVPADVRRLRAATAATATALLRGEPRAPALIATADGAITRMLLTIPSYAVAGRDNPYAAVYRDLLASCRPRSRSSSSPTRASRATWSSG